MDEQTAERMEKLRQENEALKRQRSELESRLDNAIVGMSALAHETSQVPKRTLLDADLELLRLEAENLQAQDRIAALERTVAVTDKWYRQLADTHQRLEDAHRRLMDDYYRHAINRPADGVKK